MSIGSRKISLTIQQNVKSVSNINSTQGRINQRLAVARRLLFIRCENSLQNLGCTKTSTLYNGLSEIKVYWEQDDKSDNSTQRQERLKQQFDSSENSSETWRSEKASIY